MRLYNQIKTRKGGSFRSDLSSTPAMRMHAAESGAGKVLYIRILCARSFWLPDHALVLATGRQDRTGYIYLDQESAQQEQRGAGSKKPAGQAWLAGCILVRSCDLPSSLPASSLARGEEPGGVLYIIRTMGSGSRGSRPQRQQRTEKRFKMCKSCNCAHIVTAGLSPEGGLGGRICSYIKSCSGRM